MIFGVLLLLQFTTLVTSWLYEQLNVTQWQWQSSVEVNDWLYIDGGELYASTDGKNTFYYLGQTISIDLSKSWTNLTVQNFSIDTQRPVTDGHWSKRPSMFYDPQQNQVFQWGGWPYDNGDQSFVFTFTPDYQGTVEWIKSESTPITNFVDNNSPPIFGAAFVASNTSFYSLGGSLAQNAINSYVGVQGLVEFDFSNNSWTNHSSTVATSSGFLVGAEASYTPDFGDAGYLVFIGGGDPGVQLFDIASPILRDMSEIILYDISTESWYRQTATGDVPPPRQFFCSVGVTSIQDTFEIFILGGSTNSSYDYAHPNDDGYLNVYTLSIPAFRWFKSATSDEVRRADHSCRIIGNRQMLVIGGTQPSNQLGIAAVDPWPSGLGIFDIVGLSWANAYEPSAQVYEQSDPVKDYYTYNYQAPQWDSPLLEPIFAWSPPDLPTGIPPSTTSSSVPTATSNGTSPATHPNPTSNKTTNNVAAIVGGVVGGVGGVALLLGLIYLYFRWKKGSKGRRNWDNGEPSVSELESPGYKSLSFGPKIGELHDENKKFAEMPMPTPELAGRNSGSYRIPRKPVAELP